MAFDRTPASESLSTDISAGLFWLGWDGDSYNRQYDPKLERPAA